MLAFLRPYLPQPLESSKAPRRPVEHDKLPAWTVGHGSALPLPRVCDPKGSRLVYPCIHTNDFNACILGHGER